MEGVDPNGLASGGSMDNRSAARPGHRSLIAIEWLVVGAADQDAISFCFGDPIPRAAELCAH
jgi:hypothetical protein